LDPQPWAQLTIAPLQADLCSGTLARGLYIERLNHIASNDSWQGESGGMCFKQRDENSGKISERMILGKQKVN
jgi:hypothetical protein